jgi:hypothetical protein
MADAQFNLFQNVSGLYEYGLDERTLSEYTPCGCRSCAEQGISRTAAPLDSWQAAQAFAVNKGLTVVDLDDVKTGEELASENQYPGGVAGKFCGAEVLERSGFALSEFKAFTAAYKGAVTAAKVQTKALQNKDPDPITELERAQQAHVASAGTTSRIVTSVQVRKKELYAEAVAFFESKSKGKRLTQGHRDKLWNDADQEAMAQHQVLPEEVLADARNKRTRSARTTKIRIGDAWFDVS